MPDHNSPSSETTQSQHRTSILFVCTANICRSPLAEVMARTVFDADRYVFSSAGTHAMPGYGAAENSQTVAAEHGLDLTDHRATPLEACEQPDVVIGMEQHHLVAARRAFPDLDISHIRLLDAPVAIADPYGDDLDAYRVAADHIERAVGKMSEFL